MLCYNPKPYISFTQRKYSYKFIFQKNLSKCFLNLNHICSVISIDIYIYIYLNNFHLPSLSPPHFATLLRFSMQTTLVISKKNVFNKTQTHKQTHKMVRNKMCTNVDGFCVLIIHKHLRGVSVVKTWLQLRFFHGCNE